MPTTVLSIPYKKNVDLIISPDELKDRYFFGIDLTDSNGNLISDQSLEFYIKAATLEWENYLNLKLKKQAYRENLTFRHKDWVEWGYLPATYPVVQPLSAQGYLNTTLQVDYPKQWLSAKSQSEEGSYDRNIHLVPIHGSANALSNNVVFIGISPHVGYFGSSNIPNYWDVKYITGFNKVPEDILNGVGKLAAINIFHELGDIIVGAGIASKSIGIDGLSQSISTTSSATNAGYGARIIGYLKDLEKAAPILKGKYTGILFGSA